MIVFTHQIEGSILKLVIEFVLNFKFFTHVTAQVDISGPGRFLILGFVNFKCCSQEVILWKSQYTLCPFAVKSFIYVKAISLVGILGYLDAQVTCF